MKKISDSSATTRKPLAKQITVSMEKACERSNAGNLLSESGPKNSLEKSPKKKTVKTITPNFAQVVYEFARELMFLNTQDELVWHVVDNVVSKMGLVDCVIYLLDAEGGSLQQVAAFGDKKADHETINNAITIKVGDGICGAVAASRKAIMIDDCEKDKRYIPDLRAMRSEACIPIIYENTLFGVIDSEHPETNFYTDQHIETLSTIAQMLGSRLAQWDMLEALRSAEKNLQASEKKYRHLFENSSDAMYLIIDDSIELVNEAAVKMFAVNDQNDLIGKSSAYLSAYQLPDSESYAEKTRKAYAVASLIGSQTFVWQHKNKRDNWLTIETSITASPFHGDKAYIAVCRDITPYIEANVALQKSAREAERANKAKSSFLANMSHELRTPLNAIIGMSDVIQQKLFGDMGHDRYAEYISDIHKSGTYLMRLINDILDISALDADARILRYEHIKGDTIIEDCIQIIAPLAYEKHHKFNTNIQSKLPLVWADSVGLKQVLINLIGNAIKFSPPHSIITISLDHKKEWHHFCVSDTGCGIPENRLDTITERFDRGSLDPHKAIEGTGLGLAIVQSIIDLHGGELAIKSAEGCGTSVTVSLPSSDQTPL